MNLFDKSRAAARYVEQEGQFTLRITNRLSQTMKRCQRHDNQSSTEIHLSVSNKWTVLRSP